MKIKVITTFLLFCLIAGICYYISLPDYHVRNSMSFSNQGTRDTELTITVQTLPKRKRLSKSEMPNLRIWHTLDNPNQSQPTFSTPKK